MEAEEANEQNDEQRPEENSDDLHSLDVCYGIVRQREDRKVRRQGRQKGKKTGKRNKKREGSQERKTVKEDSQGRQTRKTDKEDRQDRQERQTRKTDKEDRQGRQTRKTDKEDRQTRDEEDKDDKIVPKALHGQWYLLPLKVFFLIFIVTEQRPRRGRLPMIPDRTILFQVCLSGTNNYIIWMSVWWSSGLPVYLLIFLFFGPSITP